MHVLRGQYQAAGVVVDNSYVCEKFALLSGGLSKAEREWQKLKMVNETAAEVIVSLLLNGERAVLILQAGTGINLQA
jgi:hypothetical protein